MNRLPQREAAQLARLQALGLAADINRVAPTAIIQAKQGIGDVIWHLPFVKAIAAVSPGGRVTYVAPPTSHAAELLQAEPAVATTLYYEHNGTQLQRLSRQLRLAQLLHRHRFHTAWILERSLRPAVAALLAGIPNRIGIGFGRQQMFLSRPGIDPKLEPEHFITWLEAMMKVNGVPIRTTEPDLQVPETALHAVRTRFAIEARPWFVVGLGTSHVARDWPLEHTRALIEKLLARGHGTVFLIGGPNWTERAQALKQQVESPFLVDATALPLIECAALLKLADLFVGPDSGPMNIAAAVGTPTFGLFGVNPVLTYSLFIHAIVPDDGRRSEDGMQRISPDAVYARIAKFLDETEASLSARHVGRRS